MQLKKLNRTHVLQQDQSDCGVACLLSIIKYHGGNHDLEELRNISGTTKVGTSMLGLVQSGSKLGVEIEGFTAELKHLKEQKTPVIIHTLLDGRLQHYMIVYNFENNKFIIGNPAKGIEYYTENELDKIWVSKALLTLKPNNDFVFAKDKNNRKKKYILKLIKDDYPLLLISLVLGVALAVLNMIMALYSEKLIDVILPTKNIDKFILGTILVTLLLFVRTLFVALRERLLIEQKKNFNTRIINTFYTKLLSLPKTFFDTRKIGELISRLNDTSRIQKVISQLAGNMVIDILIALVSLVVLFNYSIEVGIISSITIPILFIILYRYNQSIINNQKEIMSNYANSESYYVDSMQAIGEIKNTGKQEMFANINNQVYSNYQNSIFSLGKINIKLVVNSGLLSVLFTSIILSYCSYEVFNNNMQIGGMMAIIGISSSMLPSITNLSLISLVINEAKVAFDRMFEFVDIKSENELGLTIDEKINLITIDNLSFRYPGRSLLLNKVNMKIKKGEMVFLMGESGGGKSTLAQLLQKSYKSENGNIKINNEYNINEIDINNWRNKTSVIPQEIPILNGNIIYNIAMDTDEKVLHEALVFLNNYGFTQFIDSLPQSYQTIVGENGINLSGGQKQMIALARALFQKPELLIIDEGTSAMDYFTELNVMKKLNDYLKNGMVLFITHRSNLPEKSASKIYKLENKELIEFKSYNEYKIHQDKIYSLEV